MKYIIILGDGMADYPLAELGGKTPLEVARTPFMDRMAAAGTLGLIDTIPQDLSPGSDVANLSVLGYDPKETYSGRGPLEAASMGLNLGPEDVAFRCNLVTLGPEEDPIMEDFTSGHISSEESAEILGDLNREVGSESIEFFPGVGYRNLMIWRQGKNDLKMTPPHDITGRSIGNYLPVGDGAEQIMALMHHSRKILKDHPVNKKRAAAGLRPATSIWLWGQGRAPKIIPLSDRYSIKGGMISAVDLLNGIGICAGLKIIPVEGATGYTDTNYLGKAEQALAALKEMDFVFIHIEAPDEMGHEGSIQGKIRAIEDIDKKVVGTVLHNIEQFNDFRVMVLSDHPTPICLRTHAADPSPFAVLSSDKDENLVTGLSFCESSARKSGVLISPGHKMMELFMRGWRFFVAEKHS